MKLCHFRFQRYLIFIIMLHCLFLRMTGLDRWNFTFNILNMTYCKVLKLNTSHAHTHTRTRTHNSHTYTYSIPRTRKTLYLGCHIHRRQPQFTPKLTREIEINVGNTKHGRPVWFTVTHSVYSLRLLRITLKSSRLSTFKVKCKKWLLSKKTSSSN